jgi:hypothetical protein
MQTNLAMFEYLFEYLKLQGFIMQQLCWNFAKGKNVLKKDAK